MLNSQPAGVAVSWELFCQVFKSLRNHFIMSLLSPWNHFFWLWIDDMSFSLLILLTVHGEFSPTQSSISHSVFCRNVGPVRCPTKKGAVAKSTRGWTNVEVFLLLLKGFAEPFICWWAEWLPRSTEGRHGTQHISPGASEVFQPILCADLLMQSVWSGPQALRSWRSSSSLEKLCQVPRADHCLLLYMCDLVG